MRERLWEIPKPVVSSEFRPPRASKKIAPPVWTKDPYPRLNAGRHMVRVVDLQGPEWVRAYRRWSLRLECIVVDEGVAVSAFFNFGTNRNAPSTPGRQSKYFKAWVVANGDPPRKGEPLDWNIFVGKYFTVEVADCTRDSNDREKSDAEIYSRITEFVRLEAL
jgi:hypothetical protein